jgi:hypothetical protein
MLLININLKQRLLPQGGQSPGGLLAYRPPGGWMPAGHIIMTSNYYPFSVRLIMEITT